MSNWTFINHITDYIQRPNFGDPREPSLWPSEATALVVDDEGQEQVMGKCRRARYLRFLVSNYEYDPETYADQEHLVAYLKDNQKSADLYMQWIWKIGSLYEDYIATLAKESGVFITDQAPIYIKPYKISGKRDLIIINPETTKYRNVEVKSVYGFGANYTLGTDATHKKGVMGEPKDDNLMQIAIYDWWSSSHDDAFEYSSLLYGARDTGRYAEYEIKTELDEETGITHIYWRPMCPVNNQQWTRSPITIDSIMTEYSNTLKALEAREIPERDFCTSYSIEKIDALYKKGELNKTDTTQHEKYLKYASGESKRPIKPVSKGDWQCQYCEWENVCYNRDGEPKPLP